MVFISGYANALYEQLLTRENGWNHRAIETTTRDSSGHIHKRTEVVWMNKHFQRAQASNQVPIVLTNSESKYKKLNPLRENMKR